MGFVPDWYGTKAFAPKGTVHNSTHSDLYAISWVDPVSIVKVNATTTGEQQLSEKIEVDAKTSREQRQGSGKRRLLQLPTWLGARAPVGSVFGHQRRLKQNEQVPPEPSDIRGTNGFMIPFVGTKQLLGVAHFHREDPDIPSTFARWGHHYTHAFYTVGWTETKSDDPTHDSRYFGLSGLSAEFVIPAVHNTNDAEGVQFASGLEYNPLTKEIILTYGINDCESALIVVDLQTVLAMLRPISTKGKQVRDFMMNLDLTNVP